MHKPEFLQASVGKAGGAMIAAHPYRRRFIEEPAEKPGVRDEMLKRAGGDEFFQMCQCLEGLNGRGLPIQNQFSKDLGSLLNVSMSAGSDAHKLEQLGTVATAFQRPVADLADLILELQNGRFHPVDLRRKPIRST